MAKCRVVDFLLIFYLREVFGLSSQVRYLGLTMEKHPAAFVKLDLCMKESSKSIERVGGLNLKMCIVSDFIIKWYGHFQEIKFFSHF